MRGVLGCAWMLTQNVFPWSPFPTPYPPLSLMHFFVLSLRVPQYRRYYGCAKRSDLTDSFDGNHITREKKRTDEKSSQSDEAKYTIMHPSSQTRKTWDNRTYLFLKVKTRGLSTSHFPSPLMIQVHNQSHCLFSDQQPRPQGHPLHTPRVWSKLLIFLWGPSKSLFYPPKYQPTNVPNLGRCITTQNLRVTLKRRFKRT